ncbi:hypothetical protein GJV85_08675 [Sulfurimonas aquatica]|uniref:Ryanodine receptor Ryr domain-containing protein n=1 Tax=Sulfurimonas aquatica TaxID=2672570 RepID=A0A975B0W6_9BACT|nr:hypothetical protein [Sulfurimonas aquatica]QSZ42182.1 hypothetical protein GJV85_08675 [Sulfurimonas aquatica]
MSSSNKAVFAILLFAYFLSYYGVWQKSICPLTEIDVDDYGFIGVLAFENLFVALPGELVNQYSIHANFIAYGVVVSAILFKLFKNVLHSLRIKIIADTKHSIVIGLGENNRKYLDSELKCGNENRIIIIEPDKNNIYIHDYKDKGFVVFIGTLDMYKINYVTLEHIVVSTGNDRMNIEIAGTIIHKIPKDMSKEKFGNTTVVHIHLNNQQYKALFQQKILSVNRNLPLEFKVYSFYENAVRDLFETHTILGNYHNLASESTPYHIVLVGDGNLAERIVYHLCLLSSLPNDNHLSIHCIGENSEKFIQKLHSIFMQLPKIETISFIAHKTSMAKMEFYENPIWKKDNLANVIICDDDENLNLECVVNLHDKIYLKESIQKTMRTKILFAMYNNLELGQAINDNNEEFSEYYTFGDAKKITSRDFLIDEKYEEIAKLIHFGYAEEYKKDMLLRVNDKDKKEQISEKWHDSTTLNKRESNRSQALHINTKLMSLGLKKVTSTESAEELINHNQKILRIHKDDFAQRWRIFKIVQWKKSKPVEYNYIKIYFDINKEIKCLSSKLYSEDQLDLKVFFEYIIKSSSNYSKLAISEHERWNAFHYLNGWTYDENGSGKSQIKEHNCLLPMKEFADIGIQQTVIYDLYSILYLPNYLASTGYRIVPIEEISIGITGDKNINMQDVELQQTLTKELKKVINSYGNIKLISPLAEGADRLFVNVAFQVDTQKIKQLIVPMPFEKEDYMQDFLQMSSKIDFNHHLRNDICNDYSLTNGSERKQKSIYKTGLCEKILRAIGKLFWNNEVLLNKVEIGLLSNAQNKFDTNQYKKSRQEVVNKSDIIFAIWDGKKAKGEGGTAKIIEYAISKRKRIIWISPNTNEVNSSSYPYICSIKAKSDKFKNI